MDSHQSAGDRPAEAHRIGPDTPVSDYPGGRLGRFRVLEIVHRGEMGTLLRALDEELGRDVALKVLPAGLSSDPSFQERFVREAQAVARLQHPGICPVHSVGNQDGLLYVAMQFVHGTTLAQVIKQYRQFSPHGALVVVRAVAEALGVVHAAGLLHRDVTSSNIMVEPGGQVRLVDFGLTGFAFNPPSFAPGAYVGTPEYSSPEQCAGGDLDARSDLYSLGFVLYEMLTGRVPFVDEDPVRLFRRLRDEQPIPIRALNPRVPRGVVALFERMTAKARADRFPDAAAVVAELNRLLDAAPGPSSVPDLVRAAGPKSSWRRWIAALFVLGIAAAIGWGPRWGRATVTPSQVAASPARASPAAQPPREVPASPAVEPERHVVWKVVVLPFERVGGDAAFDWLAEGLPELLAKSLRADRPVTAMARSEFLTAARCGGGKPWVLPPRESQEWIEGADVTAAMDSLGVAMVVTGRFTGDAAHLRIEAQVRLSPVAASDPTRTLRDVSVSGRPEEVLALVDRLVREVELLLRDRAQRSVERTDAG